MTSNGGKHFKKSILSHSGFSFEKEMSKQVWFSVFPSVGRVEFLLNKANKDWEVLVSEVE